MIKNEDTINKLFEELVPDTGKAESKAGEIIRAYSRIGYRFYNDGDMIGIGYGEQTCNAAARYLMEYAGDKTVADIVCKMWGNYNETEYEGLLDDLSDAVLDYIDKNPQLRKMKTVDMYSYRRPEDEWEDEEEEDFYEEEYDDDWE